MKITYNGSRKIRGSRQENSPQIFAQETPVNGSTAIDSVAYLDTNTKRTTVTPARNDVKLSVQDPRGPMTPVFESLTPMVCQVAQNGQVSSLSNGVGKVRVSVPGFVMFFERDFQSAATVVLYEWQSWATGSLAKHIDTAIRAMVSGKSPGTGAQSPLSSYSGTHASPAAVRNAGLFTGSLDLTAVSVYRSTQGWGIFPAVLITARHVVTGHVAPNVGETFLWLRSNGTFETRTVVSVQRVSAPGGEDYVALLDADVTGITPMRMMPNTWTSKLPCINGNYGNLSVLNKGCGAGDKWRVLENSQFSNPNWLMLRQSTDSTLSAWSSSIIGGDSNGPVLVPVNGNPVLLHCMNTAIGGYHYSSNIPGLQSQLNSLSTSAGAPLKNIVLADLSGFTSYS